MQIPGIKDPCLQVLFLSFSFCLQELLFLFIDNRIVKDNDIDVVIFQDHTFLGSESRNLISYFKKLLGMSRYRDHYSK